MDIRKCVVGRVTKTLGEGGASEEVRGYSQEVHGDCKKASTVSAQKEACWLRPSICHAVNTSRFIPRVFNDARNSLDWIVHSVEILSEW